MNVRLTTLSGFTLLEVLIAWLILTVVLLGCMQSQVLSLRKSTAAMNQTVAMVQVKAMLERLRANTDEGARQQELRYWNAQNAFLLPEGVGSYSCQAVHACEVELKWQGRTLQSVSLQALL